MIRESKKEKIPTEKILEVQRFLHITTLQSACQTFVTFISRVVKNSLPFSHLFILIIRIFEVQHITSRNSTEVLTTNHAQTKTKKRGGGGGQKGIRYNSRKVNERFAKISENWLVLANILSSF